MYASMHIKTHIYVGQSMYKFSKVFLSLISVRFEFIHCSDFLGSEGYVALDRNPGPGYDTLLLRLIPGDILSACPHRQFHTLPDLLCP